jgi:predicted transcriptional regulator
MELLWDRGPLTPAEVHEALRHEDLAYTTIFTELSRLLRRGLIRKRGRRHLGVTYEPTLTREEFTAEVVADVVGDLLESHGSAALHGFVNAMDDRRLAVLQKLMDARKRKKS